MKPGKPPAQPHRLREATPEQAEAVRRDGWTDPFGAVAKDGRVWVDTKLPRKK